MGGGGPGGTLGGQLTPTKHSSFSPWGPSGPGSGSGLGCIGGVGAGGSKGMELPGEMQRAEGVEGAPAGPTEAPPALADLLMMLNATQEGRGGKCFQMRTVLQRSKRL